MNSIADDQEIDTSRHKLFKDTVHGYIRIPNSYCDELIDTPHFQRLRRIEQTSMRTLYPCARHDRFSHSLGVYHLGSIALEHLERNSKTIEAFKILIGYDDLWKKLKNTFHVACLLHDIGHAPFSHTFEKYYNLGDKNNKNMTLLDQRILEEARRETCLKFAESDNKFEEDYSYRWAYVKAHEKLSALILLETFTNKVGERLRADPLLAARMIIGCTFRGDSLTPYQAVANCLVTLLNGDCIDVDKLDYTSRDLWATGVETSTVDLSRLLTSICIRNQNPALPSSPLKLAFKRTAISAIESVLDIRNFQYVWIISHHKVVFDQYLLDKAIQRLALNVTRNNYEYDRESDDKERKKILDQALSSLFSVSSFSEQKKIGPYQFYLLTDDDLIFLMKQEIASGSDEGKFMYSWLYRQHELTPLWKSYPEFRVLFPAVNANKLQNFKKIVENTVQEFTQEYNYQPYIIDIDAFTSDIRESDILIDMYDSRVTNFASLELPGKYRNDIPPYFYVFLSKKHEKEVMDNLIKKLQRAL